MSGYDDDNIEFDFFDEPETVEATQRRRLPRLERPGSRGGGGGGERPPRPPRRPPPGVLSAPRPAAAASAAAASDGARAARAADRPDRTRDRDRRRARVLGRLMSGQEQARRVRVVRGQGDRDRDDRRTARQGFLDRADLDDEA